MPKLKPSQIKVGMRFGRRVVLTLGNPADRNYKVFCRCDCGESAWVQTGQLLSGKALMCNRCAQAKYRNSYEHLNDGTVRIHYGATSFIIDAEDFPLVKQYQWHISVNGYPRAKVPNKRQTILLHALLIGPTNRRLVVDHIDGDRANNRRSNLRICTPSGNAKNLALSTRNKSGFKGVCWNKQRQRWEAQIGSDRIQYKLGFFDTPVEAAVAYDRAASLLHGEFARTNADLGLL